MTALTPIIFHNSQPVEYAGKEMTNQQIEVFTWMLGAITAVFIFVALFRMFTWITETDFENDWAEFIFFPNLFVGAFNIFVVLIWLFAGIVSIVEYSIINQ